MKIRVGVENGNDGRSLSWVLDHPGCFLYGKDESEVILNLPREYQCYAEWIASHTNKPWLEAESPEIILVEVWNCYFIDDDYKVAKDGIEINAWFRDDWRPLTAIDIDRGTMMLNWSRSDLLQTARGLEPEQLTWHKPETDHWTIERVLQHIANAEWWYLDRLELAPWTKTDLPAESFERLTLVRERVMKVMGELAGLEKVVGKEGEIWSPRKMLRRFLYHERDHLGHILQIMSAPH